MHHSFLPEQLVVTDRNYAQRNEDGEWGEEDAITQMIWASGVVVPSAQLHFAVIAKKYWSISTINIVETKQDPKMCYEFHHSTQTCFHRLEGVF